MGELKEFFTTMLQTYWGEGVYQYWLLFAIVSIQFVERDKTKKLTYGIYSLLVLLIIFNPFSIKLVELFFAEKYTMQYFVRLFTEIPIMCVLAYGLTVLLKKSKGCNKILLTTVLSFAVVIGGNGFYYSIDWMQKSTNVTKISDDIIGICNYLHSDNIIEVAVPTDIASYVRQIDASLVMPYGRYGSGWANLLTSDDPNAKAILEKARGNGCDYVVVVNSNKMREVFAERNLNPEYETNDYLIYHVEGVVGVRYRYNEIMQRVSVTYIDENDNIVTGSDGCATVKYEYDKEGNIVKETYYDEKDNPTALSLGQYGVHRTYDENGMVNQVTYIDADKKPVLLSGGYATVCYERDEAGNNIYEYYLDVEDKPVELPKGYYGIATAYDNENRIEKVCYTDQNRNPVLVTGGYAYVKYCYNDDNTIREKIYYDLDKKKIEIE